MKKWIAYSHDHPLRFALFVALFLRLIASFFSKGYIAHDDHFTIIESAASFAAGDDYRNWLPGSPFNKGAEGHSFFYIGIHYIYFKACSWIGLDNPHWQMLLIRLAHAFYSLLTIVLGFKITQYISNTANARRVALILATLAIFPNYSVRNLVEMVCIAPMLWATWILIQEDKKALKWAALAGFAIGLAIGIRYQSGVFAAGLGMVLLFQKRWLQALVFGFAGIATFFLTQGADLFLWGKPFAEFWAYVEYNLASGDDYLVQAWYSYLFVILGFLVPPISIMLLFGFFKKWKSQLLLFFPSFLFLVIHSGIANKQERFVFPILPFIAILGVVGWIEFYSKSSWWKSRTKLHRGFWTFFWVINIVAGSIFALSYGKKARVEAMYALYQRADYRAHISDNSERIGSQEPLYYTGKYNGLSWNEGPLDRIDWIIKRTKKSEEKPNYIVFHGDENLDSRIEVYQSYFPSLTHVESIEPSMIDWLLHQVNDRNKYVKIHIYHFAFHDL